MKHDLKILIRFDDICPTMDYKQFERAMDVLDSHNVKALFGVVPDCKDKELEIQEYDMQFWDYMKKLQENGHALAMHGYQHIYDIGYRGKVSIGYKSEFAGHSYETQFEKIKYGKEKLESHGIKTDIFFAPAHSYDDNTIRALYENGFRYMSDGKTTKPIYRFGIKCIPCKSLGCPIIKKAGNYTAVFHAHEWNREDKAVGYRELCDLCENYQESIVNFDEYVETPAGNYVVQNFIEIVSVFYERNLRPILSKLKKILLRYV